MKPESVWSNFPGVVELLNAIPHGIALLDTNLCIVALNRSLEGMIGYSTDEVKGIYGDFILRTNLGNNDQVCRKVMEHGKSVSMEGDIISKGRKKISIQFTLSRLHDLQNRAKGILVVLEDMSALQVKKIDSQRNAEDSGILGSSQQMKDVFELMSVLSRTDASVLITGETGTGKDKIAEQLHMLSPRGRQPFIKVNCGALPEALLESELFGHTKGAFTGAVKDSIGKFRLADKGTLFLTEIGDLSLPLQVKLLSVLDDQEFFPVGGSKKIEVDVRIMAATHRSLRQEVAQGRFREDLFYRLNVLHLHIPPLRERDGDIRLLLDFFLQQFRTKLIRNITGFSKESIALLNSYHYPGNVRELRNIMEHATSMCQEGDILVDHLPQNLVEPEKYPLTTGRLITSSLSPVIEKPLESLKTGGWAEVEKEKIMEALRMAEGNRSAAAQILGWGRTTLWRKIKKYQLS